MEKLTFEQLPEAVALLLEKVDRIENLLESIHTCAALGEKSTTFKRCFNRQKISILFRNFHFIYL